MDRELKVFPFSLFIYLFFNFPHSLFFLFFFLSLLSFVLLLLCHLIVPCVTLSYYLVALSCYLDLLPYCATSSHRPIVLPPRVASLLHCVALHVISLLHCFITLLHYPVMLPFYFSTIVASPHYHHSLLRSLPSLTTSPHYFDLCHCSLPCSHNCLILHLLSSLFWFIALVICLFIMSFIILFVNV